MVGYKNNVCAVDQNPNVAKAILYLFSILPMACLFLGNIFTYLYPIDEEKAKENTRKVKELHVKC
jgi:Na+/melibiose symporter-like transporter